uniref:Uncharacterized protein n=1 Tax=Moorena producens (strain JHB) TaxID=1454205 RepID=A0A1D9G045_MOOP1
MLIIALREPCLDAVAHGGNPQDRAASLQNVLNRVFFWRRFLRIITRSNILRVVFRVWAKFGIHLGHLLLVFNNIIITIKKYFVKGFYDFFWGKVFSIKCTGTEWYLFFLGVVKKGNR